jgi:D-methionine transport system substrate-binding protein
MKKIVLVLLSIVLVFACKKEGQDKIVKDKVVYKIGVMSVPFVTSLNKYIVPALAKEGIDLQVVEFSDYNTPNLALNDGNIDINAFQHKQFLDKFNATNNTDIVPISVTVLSTISLYSKKISNVNEIKDDDKIAIPNDPTNEGRVLLVLQNQTGLIKLRDDVDVNVLTPRDIIENPKNIQFIELDAAQLPRVIDDFVAVFMNGNYAINAGFDPVNDPILKEDAATSPYVNVFAVKRENKNDPRIEKLIKAFHTKEVAEQILEETKGGIVPAWKY